MYQTKSSTSGTALVFPTSYPTINLQTLGSAWKGQLCVLRTISNFIPAGNPKLVIAKSGVGHLLGHSTNHEGPFTCLPKACHLAQLQLDLICCSSQFTFHQLSRCGSHHESSPEEQGGHQRERPPTNTRPGQTKLLSVTNCASSLLMRRSKNFSVSTESCPIRRTSYRTSSKSVTISLCPKSLTLTL